MDAACWRNGGGMNPNALSFKPSPPAAVLGPVPATERMPCRFFLIGACKYGSRCVFSHDVPRKEESFMQGSSEPNVSLNRQPCDRS